MTDKLKRVVRTVFQTGIGLAGGLPLIIAASGVSERVGGVAIALAVAAGLTRIMALPVVENLLDLVGLGFVTAPQELSVTPTSTTSTTSTTTEG